MKPIYVTKSFLPPIEEYQAYVAEIWRSGMMTNQGPLLEKFEAAVSGYLGTPNVQIVTNGTLAIQLALRALDLPAGSEVITTPFSYVATTSAILWEHLSPVFADIDPKSFCLDPAKIEAAITPKTKAILAVHVYGNPCDVEAIEAIAKARNLYVIYDAAHAFGVTYQGKSLLSYGDLATCSFHATKIMHSVEGGAVISNAADHHDRIELMKHFGHHGDDHKGLGINAKIDEFRAAMGLCTLKYLADNIAARKQVSEWYDAALPKRVRVASRRKGVEYNYAYYPVLLKNEAELKRVVQALNDKRIYPRRYFYPSLNTLPYLTHAAACPVSEDIASRVLCLPLYPSLEEASVREITEVFTA